MSFTFFSLATKYLLEPWKLHREESIDEVKHLMRMYSFVMSNERRLISPFGNYSKKFSWKLTSFAECVSERLNRYTERYTK